MATKSKLELAVEGQVDHLNDAQREIVLSQFSTYRRNKARMDDIDGKIRSLSGRPAASREEVRAKQAERSTLMYEYGQLAAANDKIASSLFKQLEDKE